ncbi:SH3 domain-containing protein [Parasulfitobacter algicola]|uniref:SH3 domain-containing protein n=1 Tax=Parasulfitobacter algicola TaxID=2614809 RepID=A0ABX2IS37_9RHOB|nr:SH3 domain-containing protein [Sulfitobacter algicola]NSX55713.1 SH3 domain-containing protein [Sulfitobacter algicola]
MRILLFTLLFTLPLFADQPQMMLPALFKVQGVASDDQLNVRAAPDASSDILGRYDATAKDIEVVGFSPEGKWAQVNMAGQTGWVSLAYLQNQPIALDQNNLPAGLQCFGTEPFWTLTPSDGTLVLTHQINEKKAIFQINSTSPAQYLQNFYGMNINVSNDSGKSIIRILPGRCSDGMSESLYGLHIIGDDIGIGCCSIENIK